MSHGEKERTEAY